MPNARNLIELCLVIHSVNNSIWPKDDLAKAIIDIQEGRGLTLETLGGGLSRKLIRNQTTPRDWDCRVR